MTNGRTASLVRCVFTRHPLAPGRAKAEFLTVCNASRLAKDLQRRANQLALEVDLDLRQFVESCSEVRRATDISIVRVHGDLPATKQCFHGGARDSRNPQLRTAAEPPARRPALMRGGRSFGGIGALTTSGTGRTVGSREQRSTGCAGRRPSAARAPTFHPSAPWLPGYWHDNHSTMNVGHPPARSSLGCGWRSDRQRQPRRRPGCL